MTINTLGAKMRPARVSPRLRLRCHSAAALAAGQSETKTRGLTKEGRKSLVDGPGSNAAFADNQSCIVIVLV